MLQREKLKKIEEGRGRAGGRQLLMQFVAGSEKGGNLPWAEWTAYASDGTLDFSK